MEDTSKARIEKGGNIPVKASTLLRATRAATRRAKNRDMMLSVEGRCGVKVAEKRNCEM
jgi:hypothetical protein